MGHTNRQGGTGLPKWAKLSGHRVFLLAVLPAVLGHQEGKEKGHCRVEPTSLISSCSQCRGETCRGSMGSAWIGSFLLIHPCEVGAVTVTATGQTSRGTETAEAFPGPREASTCLSASVSLFFSSLPTLPPAALLSSNGNFLESLARIHRSPGRRVQHTLLDHR